MKKTLYINLNSAKLVKPCLCCDDLRTPGELFCSGCLGVMSQFAGNNLAALKAHLIAQANTSLQGGADSGAGSAIPSPGGEGQGEGGLSAHGGIVVLDLVVERVFDCWEPNIGHFERLCAQVRLPGNPDWTKASVSYFNLN